MATLEDYGHYGKEVTDFVLHCEKVMKALGFTNDNLRSVYNWTWREIEEEMHSIRKRLSDNEFDSLYMRCFAYETVIELNHRFPNEKFGYEIVDIHNAHLIVNGRKLEQGEPIEAFLNNYYTDEPMKFTEDELGVYSVEPRGMQGEAPCEIECAMAISYNLAREAFLRKGFDLEDIDALTPYDEDWLVHFYVRRDRESNVEMFVVLIDAQGVEEDEMISIPLTCEEKQELVKITQEAYDKHLKPPQKQLNVER